MNRIKSLRAETKKSMRQIALELEIPYTTYVSYEKGDREPNFEMLIKLADFFDCSVDYLIGKSEKKEILKSDFSDKPDSIITLDSSNIRMIPLFETVSAGFGTYADSRCIGFVPIYIESNYDAENMLAIKVKGDSMYPKIEDGDTIVVRKQSDFENGDIVVVLVDNEEGLVKKIYQEKEKVTLISINPEYKNRDFVGSEIERLTVVGVVKKIIKEI